jgi:glucosamine 6-phosphate synthetase-like amidotransferase/phosphosugar isomerase protein
MCGIFGYVTNKEEALGPILIAAAAERLTYRGYDSVGAARIKKDKLIRSTVSFECIPTL